LADHHYYEIAWGKDDTSVGRLIMNGTALNPVFSVFWRNGYKIQMISRGNYFGAQKGSVDYTFPSATIWDAFGVFDNDFLNILRIKSGNKSQQWQQQKRALDDRIEFVSKDESPWFTFAYIYLPGHSKLRQDSVSNRFPDRYRRQLREANGHIRHIVDLIRSKDPQAILIVMGDHGGWRRPYGSPWRARNVKDVNEIFEKQGAVIETITMDIFGIMIALNTGGRCDDHIYDSLSPVNLMRVVFSCLSDESLMVDKPADDAFFGNQSSTVYRTVRSGKVLERWEPLHREAK
jgi:hypothetical protein